MSAEYKRALLESRTGSSLEESGGLRIGIDIGGTFTDVTLIDSVSGAVNELKFLTSVVDPGEAVLRALDDAGIDLGRVSFFSHGTTIGINMIVERKGARTGLVATKGFRDILELRRGSRTHLLDPLMETPYLFLPRRWRAEIAERIDWNGDVLVPIDDASALDAVRHLVGDGVESVAVCLLHSYANPSHERRLGELLEREFPNTFYTLSTDVNAEIGEYERTSTAALNAYVHPGVSQYLSRLERDLRGRGLAVELHVMQSNGGIITSSEAKRSPIRILESGPAAGSVAVAHLGSLLGLSNLVSFDMGGTTAKASVIEDGRPRTTEEFEIFEMPEHPGSGWPIRVPMIDIVEVGAGGGSIAWIDEGGELQVGPRSAGAEPGPICYGRGGTEPTVTDANAVVGRLSTLLGGTFALDTNAARSAIDLKLARPLGLSVEEAAAGILEINDAKAADLLREVTVARGRDPRDFTLVAIGGAGPMAAANIMGHAGMMQVLIPPMPGTYSAMGLLLTDLLSDGARSMICMADDVDPETVRRTFTDLEKEARRRLRGSPSNRAGTFVERSLDMRYKGQFHTVNVAVGGRALSRAVLRQASKAFHEAHLRLYVYQLPDEPVEIVNVRVRVVTRVQRPRPHQIASGHARDALVGERTVYFRGAGRRLKTRIYRRDLLGSGSVLEGPAVVEERSSTTLVPPDLRVTVDVFGDLILKGLE